MVLVVHFLVTASAMTFTVAIKIGISPCTFKLKSRYEIAISTIPKYIVFGAIAVISD